MRVYVGNNNQGGIMKKLMLVLGLLLLASPLYANEHEPEPVDVIELITKAENELKAPVNQPISAWNTAVDIVGRLDPSLDYSWDLASGEQFYSASISTFDFKDDRLLKGTRLHVGKEQRVWGSVSLNYINIFGKFMPEPAKDKAFLSRDVWKTLGGITYTTIGVGHKGDLDGDDSEFIVPVSFGIGLTF